MDTKKYFKQVNKILDNLSDEEFIKLVDDAKDDRIFIIPTQDKPVKIIYEELPCPILYNLEIDYRCKYAKDKLEDFTHTIYCSNKDECNKIEFEGNCGVYNLSE